jgi:hypothetical protein
MKKPFILSPNKLEVKVANKVSLPILPTTVVLNNGHLSWCPYASSTVACTLSGSKFSTLTVIPNNATVSLASSDFTNFLGKIRVFAGSSDLLATTSVLPAGCVVEVYGLASFGLTTANQSNAINYYLYGIGSATNGALKLGSSCIIGTTSNIVCYNNDTLITGNGTINAQIIDDGTGYAIKRIGSLTNVIFGTSQTATRNLNLDTSTYTTLENGVTWRGNVNVTTTSCEIRGATTTGGTCTVIGNVVVNGTFAIITAGAYGNATFNIQGNLTLGNAYSKLNINSTTTTVSTIAVNGNVDLTSTAGQLHLLNALNAGTYTIISCTGTMSGTLPTLGTNSTGRSISIQKSGNNLIIVAT